MNYTNARALTSFAEMIPSRDVGIKLSLASRTRVKI